VKQIGEAGKRHTHAQLTVQEKGCGDEGVRFSDQITTDLSSGLGYCREAWTECTGSEQLEGGLGVTAYERLVTAKTENNVGRGK
jgi:hypothetical protein